MLLALPCVWTALLTGEPAMIWVLYFSDFPPLQLWLCYSLLILLMAHAAPRIIYPPAAAAFFSSLPVSALRRRLTHFGLLMTASALTPLLLLSSGLLSLLSGGKITATVFPAIATLTLASWISACGLMLCMVRSRPGKPAYQIRQGLLPPTAGLLLQITLAGFAPERRKLNAFLLLAIGATGWLSFHYRSWLAVVLLLSAQFLTRVWQNALQNAVLAMHQQLSHWPLIQLERHQHWLAFTPYLLFHGVLAAIVLTTQHVRPVALTGLCVMALLHCLLLRYLHHIRRDERIFFLILSSCIAIAFLLMLIP